MIKSKILAMSAVLLALSGMGMAATDSAELYSESDFVVEDSYTTEPFTGDTLGNLTAEISLDSNDTISATLKGYNSTEKTGNQSISLSDGSNTVSLDSFSSSTSTYVVDFTAENGTVSVLDLKVTGTETAAEPSGVAPSGGITGMFSAIPGPSDMISGVSNFVNNLLTGIGSFLGGLV